MRRYKEIKQFIENQEWVKIRKIWPQSWDYLHSKCKDNFVSLSIHVIAYGRSDISALKTQKQKIVLIHAFWYSERILKAVVTAVFQEKWCFHRPVTISVHY